jgi:vacuolar-type H+-ATPase subunit H
MYLTPNDKVENEHSPIVAIRQKELEIADRLAVAKAEAEQAIKAAREWAAVYCQQAKLQGEHEASSYYQAELAAADTEAQKICEDGELAAKRIAERGVVIRGEAIQRILEIVLPKVNDG